ncbi:hypothetical protein [uncultured Acetobacteroides sp.]|uniref:hypothetical protein n=1 Tax=uncultured Acetobacteroides sp. TaxID=1760811 RepID=UPI0029F4A59D|nr:hypothetical protein [uncultured Acetobacteroides sp.]
MLHIVQKWAVIAMLFTTIAVYPNNPAKGQRNFLITAGFGVPEMSNVGIHYQQGQVQLGASYGWFRIFGNQIQTVTIAGQFHIAGTSELSPQKPWFSRVGVCFLNEDSQEEEELHSLLNLQLGRQLNLSYNWGVEVYLGYTIQVGSNKRIKDSSYWGITSNLGKASFPSLGFSFYYRL